MEDQSKQNPIIDIIHTIDKDDYLNEDETKEYIQFLYDNFNDKENPISLDEYDRRVQLINNGMVPRLQYEVLKVCVDLQTSEKLTELNEQIIK